MFKSNRLWVLVTLAIAVALLAAACQPAATPTLTPKPTPVPEKPTPVPQKMKVAFVYVAPIGDLGWTWAHEQARLVVENELGIETAFIENVPEGPDAERVIRDFVTKGYDIVFATSFGFMDHMLTVAEEFPDKYFEHCSGYKTADNMATYFGRMYQPRFLSGLVAGKATTANKIGYVAAFPIPEVVRGI
ncbi:MAG TPA: BMP family ABC transporter substrate-binding protein, partial [Anaerolineae bacterium]|nr:BMP family ABC transporter substrate-binding protein [Anaerolineae bacterium]